MYKIYPESMERYTILNEELKERSIKNIEVFIIGGETGQTILGRKDFRGTQDIDLIPKYMLNDETINIFYDNGFDIVEVLEVPPVEDMDSYYKYELSNITLHYPSVEYFALSKLMTQRSRDDDDLKNYPILDKCDLNFLRDKIEEYKVELLNPSNFNYNFHNFEEYLKYRKLK